MGKDPVEAKNGPQTDGRLLRSRATRQALVEAARQIFLDKGYRDATVDDITNLAGVATAPSTPTSTAKKISSCTLWTT